MASKIPARFQLTTYCTKQTVIASSFTDVVAVVPTKSRSRRLRVRSYPVMCPCNRNQYGIIFKSKSIFARTVLERVNCDGAIYATPNSENRISAQSIEELRLFVQKLGLDHDPHEREYAIEVLRNFSLIERKCIDVVMQFDGCLNLVVNLLTSESSITSGSAAGLLRLVSSVDLYRDAVAECGAIEEIIGLLRRTSLTNEEKEQSLGTLWNLSVDEKLRMKIADMDILKLLLTFLDDEDLQVKEASAGVLANLARSCSNHQKMVEAGVISKLANFLNDEVKDLRNTRMKGKKKNAWLESDEGFRKEAGNALLELAKDDYNRILLIEEGLVPVPLVGVAAYKSFKPERPSAKDVFLQHSVGKKVKMDEAKRKAMIGRSNQQLLASSGTIELKDGWTSQSNLNNSQFTLLPWVEAVARLVLILKLEDEVAISRSAEAIADSSINEHMRSSFKEAGAIKQLIQLLDHNSYAVKCAVTHALERLSVSSSLCPVIEAGGAIHPLVNILKHAEISESLTEKTLNILARVLGTNQEMESKFYDGRNVSIKVLDEASNLDAPVGLNGKNIENSRKEKLDSAVIARLVEILKTGSPNLQRKAAHVLEIATTIDPSIVLVDPVDIASALDAVFQQNDSRDIKVDPEDSQDPVDYTLKLEETGLTISAAARLLNKLLDSEQFCRTIYTDNIIKTLRNIIKSNIPLNYKQPVAACLVKLSSLSGHDTESENPIIMEVTLHETIPRLIEQIKSSFSPDSQEAAVIELNSIISKGVVDSTQAVASQGAIFPLVNMLEEGSELAVEAALGILYNLSMDFENHAAIISAGAVPVLKRIVQSEQPPWELALKLLRNLPV